MYNRISISFLFFILLTTSSLTFASTSNLVGTKLTFERYQITAPFKVSLPVIVQDVLVSDQYPADELIVIGEDAQKQTWLAVYVFHEKTQSFIMLDKLKLADKYFAFDVSENQQGLYFLSKNEVVSLKYNDDINELDAAKSGLYLQHNQSINSIFLLNQSSFISKQDFIQDVNNDGFDDIILPDFEHTNLWLKLDNSLSYFHQSLPINTRVELRRGGVYFSPITLFFSDFNLDQRQDIAWISKGSINYFSQVDGGKFSLTQETLALAESIHGLQWWQIRGSDGQNLDQSDLTHRVVEQIKDTNGDGIVDVIVSYTQSSGVLDKVNDYEFYLGLTNQKGQLEFAKTPSTVIQAEGTLTGLKIIDVNNDGKLEVLLSSFELSLSNIIGALMSGGIDQNVLLFALNDNDAFSNDAIISKEVELSFSLSSGKSGQPIVLLSDVNGDDLQDLILSSGEDELKIFLGKDNSKLFNRRASKHEISLPKDGALFDDCLTKSPPIGTPLA